MGGLQYIYRVANGDETGRVGGDITRTARVLHEWRRMRCNMMVSYGFPTRGQERATAGGPQERRKAWRQTTTAIVKGKAQHDQVVVFCLNMSRVPRDTPNTMNMSKRHLGGQPSVTAVVLVHRLAKCF